MNKDRRKAKRLIIGLFLSCLCIALICFGILAYIFLIWREKELVNERVVIISKVIAMMGTFFLAVDFGYLLPTLVSRKK